MMEEKAGDGRPVKPHSVRQPTPWDPSSPSLVDGSLYTGSRLFMNHHDMCSRESANIISTTRAPCNLAEVRRRMSASRRGTSPPGRVRVE